jgi:hypothetical protein
MLALEGCLSTPFCQSDIGSPLPLEKVELSADFVKLLIECSKIRFMDARSETYLLECNSRPGVPVLKPRVPRDFVPTRSNTSPLFLDIRYSSRLSRW